MTNLKRVLSLALAAVMLMGMMVIGAGAANIEYTDGENIENVEAVTVLTALDVLGGYPDGSFKPEGTTAPFADVKATNWAAGYLAYLKNLGVISGIGNNKYNPQGTVTVGEFAKMLLGAAGIDGQFTGSQWLINVTVAAQKANILTSKDVVTDPATRDAVAGYTFNTLDYSAAGTGEKMWTIVSIEDGKVEYGWVTIPGTATDSLAATVFKLSKSTDPDDATDAFGRPQNVWLQDGKKIATVPGEAAILTYTTAVKPADVKKALKDMGYTVDDNVTITSNGASETMAKAAVEAWLNGSTSMGGNGILVEIYDMDADKAIDTIVMVYNYIGTVEKVEKDDPKTEADERAIVVKEIEMEGSGNKRVTLDKDTVGFDDVYSTVKAGDKVLVTPAGDTTSATTALSVSIPTTATVVPTRLNSDGTFVANGTTYTMAAGVDPIASSAVTDKEEVVLYFDSYGYVVKTSTPEAAASSLNYAYVIKAVENAGDVWETKPMAQLLLTDGSVVTVELNTWTAALDGKVVTYTVKDGVYTLSNAAALAETNDTALNIDKGVAAGTVNNKTVYFSAKTVFVVISKDSNDKAVYNVYTGIANVPSLEGDTDNTFSLAWTSNGADTPAPVPTDDAIAEVVFVKDAKESSSSSTAKDTYYILGDSSVGSVTDVDLGTYYEYAAVVNGTITTVKVDERLTTVKYVKSVTMNDKGVITGFGADVTTSPATGIEAAKDGLLKLGTVYKTYTADCAVYMIEDGKITASSVSAISTDTNDTLVYTVNEAGAVDCIFITVVD